MNTRSSQIKKIINEVKKHIHIPNHLEYEAALEAEDERLLSLFDDIFADELFSFDVLNLNELHKAQTMEELTDIIDQFTAILSFFHENHRIFTHLIEEDFFHKQLAQKGQLNAWNEIMSHSFKKLNYSQAKTLVLDSLSRLHSEHEEPKHHFSHM